MFIFSFESAITETAGKKISSYGTVLFIPSEQPIVDFGAASWPPKHSKATVCPRVLLISTWTDNRWGFVGGNAKRGEAPLDALNREFSEEMGTRVEFSAEDFIFCSVDGDRAVFFFAQTTQDHSFFNGLLAQFFTSERRAYLNEVLSVCGYPLWVEGPETGAEVSWENNVWGLPRHLVAQGGMLTPTLGNTNTPRNHFLVLLLKKNIISEELLKKVFNLSSVFDEGGNSLSSFEGFLEQIQK